MKAKKSELLAALKAISGLQFEWKYVVSEVGEQLEAFQPDGKGGRVQIMVGATFNGEQAEWTWFYHYESGAYAVGYSDTLKGALLDAERKKANPLFTENGDRRPAIGLGFIK